MGTAAYHHWQTGWRTLAILALGWVLVLLVSVALPHGGATLMGTASAIYLAIALVFCGMSVSVDDAEIRIRLGVGLISTRVRLDTIADVTPIQKHWWTGLGFRWIRVDGHNGWEWSVSGDKAVLVTLVDRRPLRIGTDDPDGLYQAIRSKVRRTAPMRVR